MVAEAGPQVNARQPEHRVWARVNSCKGGGAGRETSRAGREPVCFQGETFGVSRCNDLKCSCVMHSAVVCVPSVSLYSYQLVTEPKSLLFSDIGAFAML